MDNCHLATTIFLDSVRAKLKTMVCARRIHVIPNPIHNHPSPFGRFAFYASTHRIPLHLIVF